MPESPHPIVRTELPAACTLGPGDGQTRMRRWQRLAETVQQSVTRDGHRVVVRYRADPAVREDLRLLAQAERGCCAFAEWNVTEQDGHVDLVVSARSGRPGDIDPLVVLFRAG